MKDKYSMYKRLTWLAVGILCLLVLMQVNWLWRAVMLHQEEQRLRLERLAPEVALAVNALDHDKFHNPDLAPGSEMIPTLKRSVDSVLHVLEVKETTHFALLQDTSGGLFLSDAPDFRSEFFASGSRACLSCIVSFSTVQDASRLPEESEADYIKRLNNSATFQYFSPVDRTDRPEGTVLWLSLYQPGTLSNALRSLTGLFLANLLLLLVLLGLFSYLVRALGRHKQASQVKEDFFNQMTHEFKTPLSSIRLASTVLRQSNDPERNAAIHQLIERECKVLERQVDKLLMVSLMERKGLEMEREWVDIKELIAEIPVRLQMLVEAKAASIELDLQAGEAVCMGDRTHLSNALANLVENSLKYGPQGVRVQLSTLRKEGRQLIVLRDNGPGIAAADRERVFEPFFRSKQKDQYKGQGFGLGLGYVKQVVEAHGGRIVLGPDNGEGCEFTIELP